MKKILTENNNFKFRLKSGKNFIPFIPFVVVLVIAIFPLTSSGQGTFTLSPIECIVNGNFSLGNIGFFSDYIYSTNDLNPEGNYTITDNPQKMYIDLSACSDHTTGDGLMYVANGDFNYDQIPGLKSVKIVWGEEIKNIIPNTDYLFSFWSGLVHVNNPSAFAIYVNNILLDTNIVPLPNNTCIWDNSQYVWSSGNNTSATITLIDTTFMKNVGNDFMMDDISFKPICSLQADAGPDIKICKGSTTTIGSTPIKGVPPFIFTWTPAIGLNSTIIQSPTVSVDTTTTYFLTVQDSIGCFSYDTVNVTVIPYPPAKITTDKAPAICTCDTITLAAPAGYSYKWSTGDTTQVISTRLPGKYSVTITNGNLCSVSDSVVVSLINDYTNIKLDTIYVNTGDLVNIPLHIVSSVNNSCALGNYTGTIQFDQSLLVPAGNTPHGTVNGNIQTIDFSGKALTPDLINFQFVATLGDSICTTIQLSDFKWDCDLVKIARENGLLCIKNVCTQPVPRLFDGSAILSLAQNNPNPASGQTKIVLSLFDDDNADLYLVNILGVKVAELGKFNKRGEHHINIDVSDLLPGIYFYILQTPTQILTKRMEIVR